jgi:beta-N-acetylhexosaminidase
MSMDAVTALEPPGRAAVRAVKAGNDVVLHSPDDRAAFAAIREAIERGEIDRTQADESVRRILRAKARLRLHEGARIALDEIPTIVGTRAHRRVADEVSQRAVTLVRDARGQVPLRLAPGSRVLYLSMLDYPSGWRIAAPSRTFVPELDRRWPGVTAIELSDRSTRNEIDLVRTMARRFDAIVAGVFVRTGAFSGRMDLAPPLVQLLRDLARASEPAAQPLVAVFFGSPYVPTFVPELPAMLLTYDFYDGAEAAAVRALAGEAPIAGRLPVELPGLFPLGHGLDRPVP